MLNPNSPSVPRWQRALNALLTPRRITDASELRRARVFLALVLIVIVTHTLYSVVRYAIGMTDVTGVILIPSLLLLAGIARLGHYRSALKAGLVLNLLIPGVLWFTVPGTLSLPEVVYANSLVLLAGGIFLTSRLIFFLAIFNIVWLAGLSLLAPGVTFDEQLIWALPIGLSGVLVLFGAGIHEADTRQLQQQADELRQSETNVRKLLNSLPNALLVHRRGRIIYANERTAQLFGQSAAGALLGASVQHFLGAQHSTSANLEDTTESLTINFRTALPQPHGAAKMVEVTASTIQYEGQLATLMLFSSPEVAEAEARMLRQVFDQAEVPMVILAQSEKSGYQIRFANQQFCQLSAAPCEHLRGATVRLCSDTGSDPLMDAQQAAEHEALYVDHIELDGQPVPTPYGWFASVFPGAEDTQAYVVLMQHTPQTLELTAQTAQDTHNDHFQILSELMSDYAYVLDVLPDGGVRFQWLTGAVETVTGHTPAEVMQQGDWEAFIHPDDRLLYRTRRQALLRGEQNSIKFRLLHRDGSVRWVQDHSRAVRDGDGQPVRIYGAAHHITEQMRIEEQLRSHVVQQAVVAEAGLMALRYETPDDLMQHVVTLAAQVMEVDICVILQYSQEQNRFHLLAQADSPIQMPLGHSFPADAHLSQAGYTVAQQETVVVDDMTQETRFPPLPIHTNNNIISTASTVIHSSNGIYGVLGIGSKNRQHFDDDDVYFLQSLANVVSTFMERHRAQQAEREEREFAEALRDATILLNSQLDLPDVLDRMLEAVEHVVPHQDACSILLLQGNEMPYVVRLAATRGFSQHLPRSGWDKDLTEPDIPLLATMMRTKQPLLLQDTHATEGWFSTPETEWIQSYLGAPIMVQGRCIGFLNIDSKEKNAFSERDAKRLQAFADKTGNAILNAQRAQDLERMVWERTAQLKQEREQLRAILDSTGEGIFLAQEGDILYANRALAQMTGYLPQDFVDANTTLLIPYHEEEAIREQVREMRKSVEQGVTWRGELPVQRKDGSHFQAGITVSGVGDPDDGVFQAVTLVRDVSRERALDALKERFISHAAHELRSPLTGLATSMYLLRKRPDSAQEYVDKLDKGIRRMKRLVEDLLDLSAFEKGHIALHREMLILQDVLYNVLEAQEDVAALADVRLTFEAAPHPVTVWGDAVRLEQVFTNLISNAIHHTPAGGDIVLRCLNCYTNEPMITVTVTDTGAGIPPEHLPHIFEAFFRVPRDASGEKKGTGLGLSISKEIVELHGGTISVESELGRGSTFRVELPCQG